MRDEQSGRKRENKWVSVGGACKVVGEKRERDGSGRECVCGREGLAGIKKDDEVDDGGVFNSASISFDKHSSTR